VVKFSPPAVAPGRVFPGATAQNTLLLLIEKCITKKNNDHLVVIFLGGEGEIRTRGTIADTTVFKTVPLNRSGTSPWSLVYSTKIISVSREAADVQ
jgi:hypothetical protein